MPEGLRSQAVELARACGWVAGVSGTNGATVDFGVLVRHPEGGGAKKPDVGNRLDRDRDERAFNPLVSAHNVHPPNPEGWVSRQSALYSDEVAALRRKKHRAVQEGRLLPPCR